MEDLIRLLHEGNHTLVVRHADEIRTFDERGIRNLFLLYTTEPDLLQGSVIVDKIVGRAAAALMIAGGIKKLFTPTLSLTAIDLLKRSSIQYEYTQAVPCIMNRTQTALCPMEAATLDVATAEEAVERIKLKFQSINHN